MSCRIIFPNEEYAFTSGLWSELYYDSDIVNNLPITLVDTKIKNKEDKIDYLYKEMSNGILSNVYFGDWIGAAKKYHSTNKTIPISDLTSEFKLKGDYTDNFEPTLLSLENALTFYKLEYFNYFGFGVDLKTKLEEKFNFHNYLHQKKLDIDNWIKEKGLENEEEVLEKFSKNGTLLKVCNF